MPVFPLGVSALVRAEVFAVGVELYLGCGHRFGLSINGAGGNLCGSCGELVY